MDLAEKSRDVAGPSRCPRCGHAENPPENRFCGRCGASLERSPARSGELTLRTERSRVTLRERFLPNRLGSVGKTVAVSLAAVAADVGLAWLRHRLEKIGPPTPWHDAGRARQEEGSGGGPEYLHGYFLKETALLLREGRETRGLFSSELRIESYRAEK